MAGRFFCPDLDVDAYEDEVAEVLRCIIQAVNRLYDALVDPDGLEAASLVLQVNKSVRELDAGFASLLSRVDRALLEVHAALTAAGPVPSAGYDFTLDSDVFDDDVVWFFSQVASALNDLCARAGHARLEEPPETRQAMTVELPSRAPSPLFRLFAAGHVFVAALMFSLGGLALHVWTAYLFFENWGTFWAIASFFVPPFGELVAVVACFWWGVWFYLLAVAAYVTGILSFGLHSSAEEGSANSAKLFFAGIAIAMYLFLGSFCFFSVRAATLPKSLSEDERRQIEDVSGAVYAVLNNCSSSDPAVLSGLVEAKDRLRRRIREYDAMRREEVKSQVNVCLRAHVLMERDLKAYLLNPEVSERRFALSAEAREAIGFLPARMRPTDLEFAATEKLGREVRSAVPGGARRAELEAQLKFAGQRQWQLMGEVYEDLLGSPMPGREELAGRSSSSGH